MSTSLWTCSECPYTVVEYDAPEVCPKCAGESFRRVRPYAHDTSSYLSS